MNWLRFFDRERRHAESAREIQFHIDAEIEDNLARGMSQDEANSAARRKFGNPAIVREEIYRLSSIGFLENTWTDIRYALRTMRQAPAFAITAVLTLALGIGGNTAIFSVIRAVLLKPLEYRDPDRLVHFNPVRRSQDASFGLAQFTEMRTAAKSFTALGAYGRPENVMFSGAGEPEALKGARVSANFLDVLGVKPLLGRSFLEDEDKRGGAAVAMIGAGLWRRRFGGDPLVAGKVAILDAIPCTIVGVLPDGFEFPYAGVDVWLPRPNEWSLLPARFWGLPTLTGIARLKPRVTLEQAHAELTVMQHQYDMAHPSPLTADRATVRAVLLKDRLVADVGPMLWMLFGSVGFVLLIACANVASLLLARSASRSREFAVRAALGAARGRLVRQLLAESLLLAAGGGAVGVFLAMWALVALTRVNSLFIPSGLNALYVPGASQIGLDGTVLGFTVLLSIATGVLFGLFPSLRILRPDLAGVLRDRSAGPGGSAPRRGVFGINLRGLLVVGQVALSIILLIGAALLMQSFLRLHSVDPGFQPANLLTAKIALPAARYGTDQKREAFFRELLPGLEGLPGVRSAAIAMSLPTTTWIRTNLTEIEGKPPLDPAEPSSFGVLQSVTPDYFQTLGISLERGRAFTARDNVPGAPPAMILNESLARRLWPDYPRGANPIGLHIKEAYDKAFGWMEVVGIVADIHEGGLAFDAVPEFYVPNAVHPPQTAYLVVRTEGDPSRFASALRNRVLAVDREQPVSDIKTMEAVLDAALGQRRVTMGLLGSFAGVALLLALVGIYGVIAYSVAQRTQEIGIRRALGAGRRDILLLVLRQGLLLAVSGGVLGVAGAFALTRAMRGLLFGITAADPATFVGIALLFLGVALVASFIPARRAAGIDPMSALRFE